MDDVCRVCGLPTYLSVDRCPYCGQAIKWDWEEIDRKAKKSKMYREWELKNKIEV